MLLSLPTFAPEIPAIIEFSSAGERHLRLVLAMSRLGMISEDDLAGLRRTRMKASAISALIETGWQRAVGGDYKFQLISAYAQLILPHPQDETEFVTADGEQLVGVSINSAQPEWIAVGAAFEAIEAECAGLGRTALRYMEGVLAHFGMPHSPSGANEMCQSLYWQGEEDETQVLEEYDDEDADVPRRADLFEGVPEWAYATYKPEMVTVSDEDFPAHVERLADRPVGKLLAAILRLREANIINNDLFAPPYEDDEGDCCGPNEPPVALGWNEAEQFTRVFDDNYRYFCEGGNEAPWIGCIKFAPSEDGISNALPSIRHTGQVLRALDEALIEARNFNDVI
jgi:hypothetical protein